MIRRYRKMAASMVAASGLALVLLGTHAPPMLSAKTPDAPPTPNPAPYAGQQSSSVRGLTEEEIATVRAGNGMALARPGEINGYPGPRHVLAMADELGLSEEQRSAVRSLESRVLAETVPLGERFLERYAALEGAFRDGTITQESLTERTAELGQVEGELRAAHLKYHLLTRPLLTEDQLVAYARLRGYGDGGAPAQHTPGRH